MNGYIYKIINDINDKIYVGKTLSPIEKRFEEHKKDSHRAQENIRPLYRAMNKYGCEKFHIELIEECPLEKLSEREIYWISFYDSYKSGYNATIGGDGKQLYNYNDIVKGFLSGKLISELTQEFECCSDTIRNVLNLAKVDTKINANNKNKKGLIVKTLDGIFIKEFKSRKEAVLWLQENNYTKSTNVDNIIATIGRAANGKRQSAYGLKWENI